MTMKAIVTFELENIKTDIFFIVNKKIIKYLIMCSRYYSFCHLKI